MPISVFLVPVLGVDADAGYFFGIVGSGYEIVLLVLVPVPVSSVSTDGNRIIGAGAGVS